MDTAYMSFCCSAMEVGGFGGGERGDDAYDEEPVTKLRGKLKKIIRIAKKEGASVLYATTMSNQPHAAEVLAEAGFYTSKPFVKWGDLYDSRKMQAWFLPLIEYKD